MSHTATLERIDWIRTGEVARLLGISEQSVRRNAESKYGIRTRMAPGMSIREFSLPDVMQFKAEWEQRALNGTARPETA